MTEQVENQGLEAYKEAFLTTHNYLSLGSYGNESLYLKNYTTMVSVIKTEEFFDLFGEQKEEKVVLENPTEEEKLILATGSSLGLVAIQRGRKILTTKSKEEAIEESKIEVEDVKKEQEEYKKAETLINIEAVCSESQKEIFRQFHGEEYPSLEEAKEIIGKTNKDQLEAKVKLASLTLGYLDGSLYQEALNIVQIFYECTNMNEKTMEPTEEQKESVEQEKDATEVREEKVPKEQEEIPQAEKEESEVTHPQTEQVSEKETFSGIQIPIVSPTKEETVVARAPEGEKEQVQVQPVVTKVPQAMDYDQLVAEVVGNKATPEKVSMEEAKNLLNPVAVPVAPSGEVVTPQYTVPPVTETIMSAPSSLEQMAQVEVPSFEGSVGGRSM